jgi:hypothetical protein
MLVVPDLQSVAIQIMFHKKIIEMNETFIYTYVLMIYKITISAKGHPEMLGQPLFPVVVWFWTVWATSCKFFCGEYVYRWTPSILLKLVKVLNIVPKKHRPTRIITSSNPFCKALIPAFLKLLDCLVCPLKPWVVPLLLSARYDRHWKRS